MRTILNVGTWSNILYSQTSTAIPIMIPIPFIYLLFPKLQQQLPAFFALCGGSSALHVWEGREQGYTHRLHTHITATHPPIKPWPHKVRYLKNYLNIFIPQFVNENGDRVEGVVATGIGGSHFETWELMWGSLFPSEGIASKLTLLPGYTWLTRHHIEGALNLISPLGGRWRCGSLARSLR